MKVIIAGSRGLGSFDIVEQAVESSTFKITEVVSGMARGVDLLGEVWAQRNKVPVKQFPADWTGQGRKAGILRNIEMGKYADALIAVRLDKSRGTSHMLEYMISKGKPAYLVDVETSAGGIYIVTSSSLIQS